MKDAVDAVLKNTLRRRALTAEDMNMQNAMVAALAELSDLVKPEGTPMNMPKFADDNALRAEAVAVREALEEFVHEAKCGSFCSHAHEEAKSYFRQNNDLPKLSGALARPLALKELKRIISIYKSAASVADSRTKAFYDYQVEKVERLMKK